MRVVLLLLSVLMFCGASAGSAVEHKPGHFLGDLNFHWNDDGVHVIVLNNFSYTDGDNRTLTAIAGFSTDGASIPRALWTVVGAPLNGKYVKGAVIHDVGCVSHKYTWQETHRMFYDAMLDSGVGRNYAKLLYYGVRLGGPKWQKKIIQSSQLDRVRTTVEEQGGRLELEDSSTISASKSTSSSRPIETIVLYPERPLTEAEVRSFRSELEKRASKGHEISDEEIERRTASPELQLLK